MRIGYDAWLAKVLGYPVYSVDVLDGLDPDALAAHTDSQVRSLYFSKVPAERPEQVEGLERSGFCVVDTNVTLELADADRALATDAACSVVIGPGAHAEAVLDIAETSFRTSRFHLDPHISDALAGKVKREWIGSYVAGRRGIELLVALDAEQPVGFLAAIETHSADRLVRAIDLVGVRTDAQGRGIGRTLVRTFVERHRAQAERLLVGTQIANVPSLSLYHALGFRIVHSAYVLHRHVWA